MDLKLTNKKALVTGSTAGIGLAIAFSLAEEGAAVIINGRTQERVDEAITRIRQINGDARVSGFAADLGTTEGVARLTGAIASVDILINNLGIFEAKAFTDITDAEWLKIFEVNVLSGVRLSRFYLPQMMKQNWGRIVFISSESAIQIPAEMIHYGVTKTAQLALARGLAETTAGSNVTVNTVLPGPTRSEGVGGFIEDLARAKKTDTASVEKEFFQNMRPTSLLKRFERSEEIAALVTYVCSPVASGTNGAALRVDGGVVRSIV